MKGRKPHEAAVTEGWKEDGIRGEVHRKPVGRYTYLKDLDNGDVAPCIIDIFKSRSQTSAPISKTGANDCGVG